MVQGALGRRRGDDGGGRAEVWTRRWWGGVRRQCKGDLGFSGVDGSNCRAGSVLCR